MTLGSVLFTAPYILLALAALPILWLLLRAVPPAPIRHYFPAVALLLGLKDEDSSTDRTPWWLLLLRILAVAAVIVALAGPVLNPREDAQAKADRVVIVLDASWASAGDWSDRMGYLERVLDDLGRQERAVAIMRLSSPSRVQFGTAQSLQRAIAGIVPEPWEPRSADAIRGLLPEGRFDTIWLSDGVARSSRADVLTLLEERGSVQVTEGTRPLYSLVMQPGDETGGSDGVGLVLRRLIAAGEAGLTVQAIGPDPAGLERVLGETVASFSAGQKEVKLSFDLPAEIKARVTRFVVKAESHPAAVVLTDDSLKRRAIGLVDTRSAREGLELLSPLHFLEKALEPSSDIRRGGIEDLLKGQPDVIVLADVAEMTPEAEAELIAWVEDGGLLLRFAGPRLAASELSRNEEHPLLPVRLRAGGRFVGGAMSWGEPKAVASFERDSPFFGLEVPSDLRVSAQVVAQPDPSLADRVIARLTDGTPLVTRKALERGDVVLFHISANAEWSNVPLSGLFVRMLERLSVSTSSASLDPAEMEGTQWKPVKTLSGFGRLEDAQDLVAVDGAALLEGAVGPELRPGLYEGPGRRMALNAVTEEQDLSPAIWPQRIPQSRFGGPVEQDLSGPLYAFALLALAIDILATLALSGRLRAPAATAAGVVLAFALGVQSAPAQAQEGEADVMALEAASEIVLAHVLTGDGGLDEIARAGLMGLSETLYFRTSVEPEAPQGVDLERDEIALYPLLYWPISPDQATPSDAAYEKLNSYLRAGGMILFDTRDANVAGFGAGSPEGRALRRLAENLDIPEIEPVPEDHVLTRTFYLLQDFPGRYASRDVWVEASPPDAVRAEGMPFRNLNDGVTPVVIGGNDWAAAWAIDNRGAPLLPIGRGFSGERQRELAYRFGVNLVMHVLTGNYKSDQVHVPALLDRLGQ